MRHCAYNGLALSPNLLPRLLPGYPNGVASHPSMYDLPPYPFNLAFLNSPLCIPAVGNVPSAGLPFPIPPPPMPPALTSPLGFARSRSEPLADPASLGGFYPTLKAPANGSCGIVPSGLPMPSNLAVPPPGILPWSLLPYISSNVTKPVDAALAKRRREREEKYHFYTGCLIGYLKSLPGKRCSLDEFVEAYLTLPEVVSLPKGADGEPVIPPLTKKNRGDLVRLIKRQKFFKVSPLPVQQGGESARGCIAEWNPTHTTPPTKDLVTANFADKCEDAACLLSDLSVSSASSTGYSDADTTEHSRFISQTEQAFTEIIKELLDSSAHNPYKGSVPVEKIQNIMLARHPDPFNVVVGKKHSGWKEYVERHLDTFQLVTTKDGKLRMRLREHTEWEMGDLQEQHEREAKEQHFVDCLVAYLQSRPNRQCAVDEFIEEYPRLPQNQIIQASMGDGGGSLPLFPELTRKNRGDLVRLVQRHREFRYCRSNPNNTIFLREDAAGREGEPTCVTSKPPTEDSNPPSTIANSPSSSQVNI